MLSGFIDLIISMITEGISRTLSDHTRLIIGYVVSVIIFCALLWDARQVTQDDNFTTANKIVILDNILAVQFLLNPVVLTDNVLESLGWMKKPLLLVYATVFFGALFVRKYFMRDDFKK